MKRKTIQTILVIGIILTASISSDGISPNATSVAYFLPLNVDVEAFGQEYLSDADQSELKVFESLGSFNGFQLTTYLFGLLSHLFHQIPTLDQKTIVLRC